MHNAAKIESNLCRIVSVGWGSKGKLFKEVWVRPARVMRVSVWIVARGLLAA